MKLDEFIKESIVQVVNGVAAAQKATAKTGTRVSPELMSLNKNVPENCLLTNNQLAMPRLITMLELDVAVTSQEKGIIVESAASQGASRVKFSVPVDFKTIN